MPKFFMKWKVNPEMMPKDPEACMNLLQQMNEAVKVLVNSGMILDWGEYCDGSGGYTICETGDMTELYASIVKYWPYVDFDAKPVLTIDQVIESTNRIAAAIKSK